MTDFKFDRILIHLSSFRSQNENPGFVDGEGYTSDYYEVKYQQGVVVYSKESLLADWSPSGWTWIDPKQAVPQKVLDALAPVCKFVYDNNVVEK